MGTTGLTDRTGLYTFRDSAVFAARLARCAGGTARRLAVHRFPDGETLVRVAGKAPPEAVLVRGLDAPDAKLFETLLAADALRRAGARRVTLVAPYLPYMRQDAVFHPGEPVSQRVLAAVVGRAFDRVLTVEAHLHRTASLDEIFPCPATSLSAAPAIAAWLRRAAPDALVVGPDSESRPWVERIAALAGVGALVGEKHRLGDRRVRIELPALPACRRAVLIDDVATSGATLRTAARALRRAGVGRVDAVVVHAVFAPGALASIERAGVRVISCNSVRHPTNRIDLAPTVAAALARPRRPPRTEVR